MIGKRKPVAQVGIDKIEVKAWAHPPEGMTLDELEEIMVAKGYTIYERGTCPKNGLPALLFSDSERN